jgi:hypothetical protein
MLVGVVLGVFMGAVTWAGSGFCIGAAVMLLLRLIMLNHEFKGNFWGDLLWVSCGMAVLFGVIGLVVGAVVGGGVGREGRPLLSGTFDRCFLALVAMGSNPVIIVPGIFTVVPVIVTYLADPQAFKLTESWMFAGVGFVGGIGVLLALLFRGAMKEMARGKNERQSPYP